jgi:hypothetical protein
MKCSNRAKAVRQYSIIGYTSAERKRFTALSNKRINVNYEKQKPETERSEVTGKGVVTTLSATNPVIALRYIPGFYFLRENTF